MQSSVVWCCACVCGGATTTTPPRDREDHTAHMYIARSVGCCVLLLCGVLHKERTHSQHSQRQNTERDTHNTAETAVCCITSYTTHTSSIGHKHIHWIQYHNTHTQNATTPHIMIMIYPLFMYHTHTEHRTHRTEQRTEKKTEEQKHETNAFAFVSAGRLS